MNRFLVTLVAVIAIAAVLRAHDHHQTPSIGVGIQYPPVCLGHIGAGDTTFKVAVSDQGNTPVQVHMSMLSGGSIRPGWVTFTDPGTIYPNQPATSVSGTLHL